MLIIHRVHSLQKNSLKEVIDQDVALIGGRLIGTDNKSRLGTVISHERIERLLPLMRPDQFNQGAKLRTCRAPFVGEKDKVPYSPSIRCVFRKLIARLARQGILGLLRQTREDVDHQDRRIRFIFQDLAVVNLHKVRQALLRCRSQIWTINSRDMVGISNHTHRRASQSEGIQAIALRIKVIRTRLHVTDLARINPNASGRIKIIDQFSTRITMLQTSILKTGKEHIEVANSTRDKIIQGLGRISSKFREHKMCRKS
jgi:hypothetical protein